MKNQKYPYRRKHELAEELGLSRTTVYERCKEIEDQWERYGDFAIIHDGNIVLVNVLAFLDFMRYRKSLLSKNTRKYVPAYEPDRIAEQLGWKGGAL